jgi:Arc/MetJ family transcription regulator
MRTNVVLDDELIAEASRLTGIKTKRQLIHEALRLLVATKKRESLLPYQGKIRFAATVSIGHTRLRPMGRSINDHREG